MLGWPGIYDDNDNNEEGVTLPAYSIPVCRQEFLLWTIITNVISLSPKKKKFLSAICVRLNGSINFFPLFSVDDKRRRRRRKILHAWDDLGKWKSSRLNSSALLFFKQFWVDAGRLMVKLFCICNLRLYRLLDVQWVSSSLLGWKWIN